MSGWFYQEPRVEHYKFLRWQGRSSANPILVETHVSPQSVVGRLNEYQTRVEHLEAHIKRLDVFDKRASQILLAVLCDLESGDCTYDFDDLPALIDAARKLVEAKEM